MSEQNLKGSQIAGRLVDDRRLGATEEVRGVLGAAKPDAGYPLVDEPGLPPRAEVRRMVNSARKGVVRQCPAVAFQPLLRKLAEEREVHPNGLFVALASELTRIAPLSMTCYSPFNRRRDRMTTSLAYLRVASALVALSVAPIVSARAERVAPPAGYDYAFGKVRPWSGTCGPARYDYPRWHGFPVRLCKYTDIGATVETYMLNADRQKIAMWFATACGDAGAVNVRACIDRLAKEAVAASSMGVFPVDGFIPEPEYGGRCFLFRDGVTVGTAAYPHPAAPLRGNCEPVVRAEEAVTYAAKFARIMSTTREDYRAAGGAKPVVGIEWLDVVRELYQAAWSGRRNELVSARAIADERAHVFR